MLISPTVTKTKLRELCDTYIAEYDRYNDIRYSESILKIITYKNPIAVINKLKKQYPAVIGLFKCIDCDKNNRQISERDACELLKVADMTVFDSSTWTGKFCAHAILESIGFEEIELIAEAVSDDIKADTAKHIINLNEEAIADGYRLSWNYSIKALKALNGDQRVQDAIELIQLKYIL